MTQEESNRIRQRLLYLRTRIRKQCISYAEIAELQSLAKYIDKEYTDLLEWAGVLEFPDEIDKLSEEYEDDKVDERPTFPEE